jgi:hypothetical protein
MIKPHTTTQETTTPTQSSEDKQKWKDPKDTSSLNKLPMPPSFKTCTENPVLYDSDQKCFRRKNSKHFIHKFKNMEIEGRHVG